MCGGRPTPIPAAPIPAARPAGQPWHFRADLPGPALDAAKLGSDLTDFLHRSRALGLIVLKDGAVRYEAYWHGAGRGARFTIYLPRYLRDVDEITEHVSKITHLLGVPDESIEWQRKDERDC